MSKMFNKNIMLNNISFLISKYDKKIGELEAEAGVSTGYISRISNDEKAKPGIDFVVNVAKLLNVSLDVLLYIELAGLTPTEEYLVSFLEKLGRDTMGDKLDWDIETKEKLRCIEADINGYSEHPLFNLKTFYEEDENGFPEEVSRVVFTSRSFGYGTVIDEDCFNLRLKNGSMLYVMSIVKNVHRVNDKNAFAKEIWIQLQGTEPKYLVGNKDAPKLAFLVDNVYETIRERMKHPRLKSDVKYVLDAFMDDDLSDDNFEDVPF